MDNLLTAVILYIIALNSKSNKLTYLMILGCLAAWLIDSLDFDIALYYSLNAILFSLLSLYAVNIRSTSSVFYAILMIIQMFICLVLVPDCGEAGNSFIQGAAIYITGEALIIMMLIGVAGSENTISNSFSDSGRSSGVDNNRDHRDNKN